MRETLSEIDIQAQQALLSKIMVEAEWGKRIWILSVLFPTLCPQSHHILVVVSDVPASVFLGLADRM